MNKTWLKPFYVFFLLSLLFFALIGQILNYCHPYNDLGIYSEALRLIHWNDLNPFIPGRYLHIFNDHFDPILIPFAFLERWIPAPILGVTIEWLAIALCWIPIEQLYRKHKINFDTAVFSYAFLVLNHAMVDALFRPFHPTTWACLPLICVLSFYWLKNYKSMTIALLLLMACREEFPLLGIMLGVVLLIDRKWWWATLILFLSATWTIFVFKIRPTIFNGEFSNYGGSLLSQFLTHPFLPFKNLIEIGTIRMFLSRAVPLLLLLQLSAIQKNFRHSLKIFLLTIPLFGIRFASNAWGFHYGTAPVIALWFMLLPALNISMNSVNPPLKKWRIYSSWILILIIFLSPVIKNNWDNWLAWGGFEFGHQQCLNQPARISEIKKSQSWILNSGHHKILMSSNLISTMLLNKNELEFHFVGGPSSGHQLEYDVVFVEKPPSGDAWPIGHERILKLIETWKNTGLNIIIDNEFVFLAEGTIKIDQ